MSIDIAKAGSVQRLSTVLRRWKPAWLVIYRDGNIRYFGSKDDYVAKATVHLPTRCLRVISKPLVDPPTGCNKDQLFGFKTADSEWIFCAESADDAITWRLTLMEARSVSSQRVHIPPSAAYGGYTDGVNYYRNAAYPSMTVPLYDSNPPVDLPSVPMVYRGTDGELVVPQQVIEHPDGSRTIVLGPGNEVRCHCHHGYNCGCGYGYGDAALLGLAAGTLMWSPFMWAPLFWW